MTTATTNYTEVRTNGTALALTDCVRCESDRLTLNYEPVQAVSMVLGRIGAYLCDWKEATETEREPLAVTGSRLGQLVYRYANAVRTEYARNQYVKRDCLDNLAINAVNSEVIHALINWTGTRFGVYTETTRTVCEVLAREPKRVETTRASVASAYAIARLLLANPDGCTVDRDTVSLASFETGYAVSGSVPGCTFDVTTIATTETERDIAVWIVSLPLDVRYIGGWVNDGTLYVDATEVIYDLALALETANARSELAIFDFANLCDIAVPAQATETEETEEATETEPVAPSEPRTVWLLRDSQTFDVPETIAVYATEETANRALALIQYRNDSDYNETETETEETERETATEVPSGYRAQPGSYVARYYSVRPMVLQD